jgi:hypothetical protein
MIKILKSISDTYITNKIVNKKDVKDSNLGYSGTINLFKLIGGVETEYSVGLIKFDLQSLMTLISENKVDTNDHSFWAKLIIKDVYGGQTTPRGFKISVAPLKNKFDEGIGKDVVLYSDLDICNWNYSSFSQELDQKIEWDEPGCTGPNDFFLDKEVVQDFYSGEEDLQVDVTQIIREIISGEISENHGFRIAFHQDNIQDSKNYFVKRLATRHAFDPTKHPRLMIGFDDSFQDTSSIQTIGFESKFIIKNYFGGSLQNIRGSDGNFLEGEGCIFLRVSGSVPSSETETILFTGSQAKAGDNFIEGVYSASVLLTEDDMFTLNSSSLETEHIFASWEDSSGGLLSSLRKIEVKRHDVSNVEMSTTSLELSGNIPEELKIDSIQPVSIYAFDRWSKPYTAKKIFEKLPSNFQGIISDASYSVRDTLSGEVIIPFDFEKGSTRISTDTEKMYFDLDTSNLFPNRSFVIDVTLLMSGKKILYRDVTPIFKVVS